MLSYKAMAMGMQPAQVRAILLDVVISISAAGTSQTTATHLDAGKNFLSSVASGTGVRLSINATGGDEQFIFNGGANPVKVYPPVGAQINSLGTNNPVILPINQGCLFMCGSSTQWGAVLSA